MNIRELHDKLFDILCMVDDICRAEGIPYFLDSGTELGSVREKDFIAWDDDMDIKIKAEDYLEFKRAMEAHLPSYMHIAEPQDFAPYFYDFTIRIYDERYLLREETEVDRAYKNLQNHVGTDVFLMARAPEDEKKQRKLSLKTKILYGMGMGHRVSLDWSKYSGLQKLQVKFLARRGWKIDVPTISNQWFDFVDQCGQMGGTYRFTTNYQLKNLMFYPDEWLSSCDYGTIRGRQFPIPIGYDQELRKQYGDYMKPPQNLDDYIHHLSDEDRKLD